MAKVIILVGSLPGLTFGNPDWLVGPRSWPPPGLLQSFDNEEDPEEPGESRLFFSSTTAVVSTSTLIRAVGLIIGSLLIILPLILALMTVVQGQAAAQGSGYASPSSSYYSNTVFKKAKRKRTHEGQATASKKAKNKKSRRNKLTKLADSEEEQPRGFTSPEYHRDYDELTNTLSEQLESNEQGLARSFTFSNISLTITYVTVVIAALMLAGFLWMAFAYSGSGSSGYGGYRQKREVFFDDDPENYPEGIAEKLHWINESFRKYQIEDLGCQLYLSCEAGQIRDQEKHQFFGLLPAFLRSLIEPIRIEVAEFLPRRMKKYVLAFHEGSLLDTNCQLIYSAICPKYAFVDSFAQL